MQAGEGGGVVGVETFDLELASDAMREFVEEGYGQVGGFGRGEVAVMIMGLC